MKYQTQHSKCVGEAYKHARSQHRTLPGTGRNSEGTAPVSFCALRMSAFPFSALATRVLSRLL
eukprot:473062-Rhodomonas_salina.3